jgi:hypothetical protein
LKVFQLFLNPLLKLGVLRVPVRLFIVGEMNGDYELEYEHGFGKSTLQSARDVSPESWSARRTVCQHSAQCSSCELASRTRGMVEAAFASAISVAHGLDLLTRHGMSTFATFFAKILKGHSSTHVR